ncbi:MULTISPECIES: DUF5134 domain-containing protein [unclassified Frigoribacterium]|uniref:DUF5134 domain-containing protein n=1 Tax=unclassified Frigoribacterium TaxID=2627005 RepID=UPI0017834D6F|nr:DUF5134 domain-containing protein [Frigoribacterium sp. CFBP 8751]MBD8585301.1 DUF5134 domain-containing protein [Frigoribacterium sp. CFBP 8766]MBD8611605.1 DUF5134 domain-containing protein [Frigoribacterium sp. CFBP 13729]
MIDYPWNIVLTIAFAFTFVVCVGDALVGRLRATDRRAAITDGELVDVNHGVMSIAMIAMTWFFAMDVVTWAQVLLFVILGLSLVPPLLRASSRRGRTELVGHIALDAAMIWMLAAMPLLMAGAMSAAGGSIHAEHAGADAGADMLMATPIWADVVNVLFVVVSAVAALWWLVQMFISRGHRVHLLCHVVMAAGMAWMLVLMNV